jgi:uncharacterized membrane protein YjjP (DUF1212 family)
MNSELNRQQQTDIVRLIVRTGMKLLQHGAECKLVEYSITRLGLSLGLESVETAMTTNAITVTGLHQRRCVTSTRRVYDKGINMHVICEIQRLVLKAEDHELNCEQVTEQLNQIEPYKYNRWLVIVMIGLSCASFSHLFGGDSKVFMMTFIASAAAMFFRQELAHRHHNPFVIFCLTACLATLIASAGIYWDIGNNPQLTMAASVLLLVPGFPLINAVSDMVKGYTINGIGRWFIASMLTASVASGIALAMAITGLQGW